MKIELTSIFLGNIDRVDEGFEGLFHVVMAENEDLGGSDWVEPFLDPSPYGWKECGGANDLVDGRLAEVPSEGLDRDGTQSARMRDETIDREKKGKWLTKIRSKVSG